VKNAEVSEEDVDVAVEIAAEDAVAAVAREAGMKTSGFL
jgi:hypothetical protein